MFVTKESIAPVIVDTLKLPIEEAANKIISECDLTYLTPEEVMDAIRHFRQTRKGLELCADTLAVIYRRKNAEEDSIKLNDADYSGILGTISQRFNKSYNNRP